MNKLWLLIKVNLLNLFGIGEIINAKTKEEKNKHLKKQLIFIGILLFFSYYIYIIANISMKGFILLNIPYIILAQYFVTTSIYIMFTNIFQAKNSLFSFRDYDLLMSLPIPKKNILLSKIITSYLYNLIYVFVIMLPVLIVYINYINVNILFYILYFISMLVIPIIPMIVSYFVGLFISYLTSFFKKSNFFDYLFNILLIISVLLITFKLDGMTSIDLANLGKTMISKLQNIYPLINIYIDIIKNQNILSLVIIVLLSFIFLILFMFLLNKYYLKIREQLQNNKNSIIYKNKKNKINLPVISLYKKELNRYFSSTMYVLNTALGCILLITFLIALVFLGDDYISRLIGTSDIKELISMYAPLIISMFCAISCTTHSSISLEGNNIWILKTLPLSYQKIFLSKIMVNLTILLPTIIISSIILIIHIKPSLVTIFFLILTPSAYSIMTSCLGLILNLKYPDINFKSEVKVIKQSIPSYFSMMIGLLMGMFPLMIKHSLNSNLYILLITIVVILIDICLFFYLKKKGKELFNNL